MFTGRDLEEYSEWIDKVSDEGKLEGINVAELKILPELWEAATEASNARHRRFKNAVSRYITNAMLVINTD